ncbi:MAG TPA: ThuA domain-containing protein [Pirellulales bacterium]|nr:ThuA domain-containing protein [Pirellulales bacterium]
MRVQWQRLAVAIVVACGSLAGAEDSSTLKLNLRRRTETSPGSGRYHTLTERDVAWDARQTAIIVCDMWDAHHCLNAVRRVHELAPRMNQVLHAARDRGALVIHAPSGCMEAYANRPGRQLAKSAPSAGNLPGEIGRWCRQIPNEDRGAYPLDQRAGGEDDDPVEHRQWHDYLASIGRHPKAPWKAQFAALEIDDANDAISDSGVEIWNLLDERGIKNVILLGVHTNMCVLGRPFGLRQLAKNGKHVVLMRDMTDTMYDPAKWPYVSHFTGTDLIVEHIEKFVCPTVASGDLLGDGREFRFSGDRRPQLALLVAEDEYKTEESLPKFAAQYLGRDYRVSFIFGSDTDRRDIPAIEALDQADALLVSVRRRPLPAVELDHVRRFVAAGKPMIGIRTASHAFAPPAGKPLGKDLAQGGVAQWADFDQQVWGGNYVNHHANDLHPRVAVAAGSGPHAVLAGISLQQYVSPCSLYKVSPLLPGTQPLLLGMVPGFASEPVAWTRVRADGGRSFYTSLGHIGDFSQPAFCQLLFNGINWACNVSGTPPSHEWTATMPDLAENSSPK